MSALWRRQRRPKSKAAALASIRSQMAAMGLPLDHLSDAELEQRIDSMGSAAASAGMTAEQAKASMRRMNRLLNRYGRPATEMAATPIRRDG